MNKRIKNLSGRRFGRLTALNVAGTNSSGGKVWNCVCECGSTKTVSSSSLLTGTTQSCGCLLIEARISANTTHGLTGNPMLGLWEKMMARCYCKTNAAYDRYGGRGIFVEQSWHDVQNFIADMGPKPEGMSLDRKNNDGPYSKENCRWATPVEQGRNKRNNRLLEFRGQTKCMAEWCEELGLKTSTVCRRLNHCGWSVDRALSTPVQSFNSGELVLADKRPCTVTGRLVAPVKLPSAQGVLL